jgi:hypothetical protein
MKKLICVLLLSIAAFAQSPSDTKAVVSAKELDGPQIDFQRPEQIALMFVVAIADLQDDCKSHAKHICTLPELIAGPKSQVKDWTIGKLKFDPNKTDPNYTYKVASTYNVATGAGKYEIWATPKKPGLGGFYWTGRGFIGEYYYNPSGAAAATDKKLDAISVGGDSFKQEL